MLFLFFEESDLSLRTVGQAIHRLGLLYASLHNDQKDHGMATTVALILRTMDSKRYGGFVTGEVSDAEIVDAIFDRSGLKTLRCDERSATFEVAVILAKLEDILPDRAPMETRSTPLRDRYDNWPRPDRGQFEEEEFGDEAHKENEHAGRVKRMVKRALDEDEADIGFSDAARRLEFLSNTLIDDHVRAPAEKS